VAFAIVAILNMWLILASNLATTCISVTIHCGFYVLDHLASRAADSQNLEDGSARKKPQSKQSHNKMRHVNTVTVTDPGIAFGWWQLNGPTTCFANFARFQHLRG